MTTVSEPAATTVEVRRPHEVLWIAGGLGVLFQLLFWDVLPGLAVPEFVLAVLAAVVGVARRQGTVASAQTVVVMAVAAAFALAVAVRAEPVTTVVNVFVVLGALAVLVHAYPTDHWIRYGLRDWLLAALRLAGHEITGAPGLVGAARRTSAAQPTASGLRRALPLLRGVALLLPVLAVFSVLLASADVIFAQRLTALGDLVRLPRLDQAVGRFLLAATVTYLIAGALWHQLHRRQQRVLADQAVPRMLGFSEAAIVLVGVDLLFAAFVAVQARYFFGGQAAVLVQGMTYAEYTRRGFAELVVVAVVSLCLHLALAGLTRRETRAQRVAFTALTTALTGLVLVILASSFARLLLYEQAFGFTRARAVAHVFMVWLALLLVALLWLELRDRVRWFLLASLVAAVGFAATLNVVGVDALIVRQNLARAQAGAELDVTYLAGLSPDAVPALTQALPTLDAATAADVRAALGCVGAETWDGDWRSLRLADVRARQALAGVTSDAAVREQEGCPYFRR
ncbi:MAG: DUF4173 domain-containing protein [Actinomycetota bacterium]|nr:DUF4173 domain-containing protein [Actinomycetota bacterium]